MEYIILTGISGAGKSTALKIMEDIGFFCVDNLPVQLLEQFVSVENENPENYQRAAIGIDIRSGDALSKLEEIFTRIRENGTRLKILFLDASDTVLIKRYKETRRAHPLSGSERIEQGLKREREALAFLKKQADYILDTSELLNRDLRRELTKIFVGDSNFRSMMITVLSFGFKYGIPADADLVFDVRFLPNPFYVEELRKKTGNDPEVRDYVLDTPEGKEFLERLGGLLHFLIPHYISEGKTRLVIAVGCTGGRHRSVSVANAIYQALDRDGEFGTTLEHRDMERKDNHVVLN